MLYIFIFKIIATFIFLISVILLVLGILIISFQSPGFILLRKHQKPEASLFKDNISEIETITEIFKDRNYYDRKTKHLNRVALAIVSGENKLWVYINGKWFSNFLAGVRSPVKYENESSNSDSGGNA